MKLSVLNTKENKIKYIKDITEMMPEHSVFVDVFGGGGNIILNKDINRKVLDIYNDIDSSLLNVFKVLQDENKREKLVSLFELTPTSRQLFDEIKNGKYKPEVSKDVLDAYVYIFLLKQSFSGHGKHWSSQKKEPSKTSFYFVNLPDYLYQMIFRLKHLQIENLDYRECILKYDSKNTFMFIDPPENFDLSDNKSLFYMIKNISGKFLLMLTEEVYNNNSVYFTGFNISKKDNFYLINNF